RGGDISHEGAFAFDQIVGLAARLNEALQSIHNAGIIHRDIKPENLYRLNGKVVIGDFGIARTADDGFTTTFAGTPGYIPPWGAFGGGGAGEAFKLDVKWDYYSLAPTLASLYEGHDIYRDIDNKKRTQCITTSRLPLTKADPNRRYLEYLLFDLYQMLPDNMSGYEDVKKWVADHSYRKNGLIEQGAGARGWPRPFQVSSTESYDNEKDLFIGLTSDHDHWERAKKLLYAKYFEEFFKSFLPGVALAAQTADDEWRTVDEDKGLAVFLKALYPSGPLVWKGYTFSSLRELGERMKATSKPEGYAEILDERLISDWLAGTPDISVSDETVKLVGDIEKLAGTEPGVAVYWFGNAFAAEPGITVMDFGVSGVGDLSSVMFTSPRMFYEDGGLDMLLDRKKGAALYGFLYSLGYKDLIGSVMEKDSERSEFSKACVRIAMLEMIAEKEGDMNAAEDIKKFYVEYGPAAYAAYVKKLVERTNGPVYRGLDREGEHVLSEIKDYRLLTAGAFSDVSRSLAGLVTLADKMRGMLIDNPYLIAGGVYETHGVLCLNLVGCFAFEILGKKAPLGFASHIGQ
ncbi:MAG: hypothetical protein K6D94_04700, partial [Clostridiales bacterium]|nr:hypothetical protein [Clostridiales bacterium]